MIFRAVIAKNKGIFINTHFLLERCCLPAILKACTALKKALRIDHLYIAKGSAPGKKKKSSLLKKSLKTIARGGRPCFEQGREAFSRWLSGFILEIAQWSQAQWSPFCNFRGPFFKKGGPRKERLRRPGLE